MRWEAAVSVAWWLLSTDRQEGALTKSNYSFFTRYLLKYAMHHGVTRYSCVFVLVSLDNHFFLFFDIY